MKFPACFLAKIRNAQLQTALNSRIFIEQAKGVLAERGNLDIVKRSRRYGPILETPNTRLAGVGRAIVEGTLESTDDREQVRRGKETSLTRSLSLSPA